MGELLRLTQRNATDGPVSDRYGRRDRELLFQANLLGEVQSRGAIPETIILL